jgi:hypothetical protein
VLDELDAAVFVDAEGAVGSVDDDILTGTTRRSVFTADQPPPPDDREPSGPSNGH